MNHEINVWVLYDVSDDKIRTRLAEKCKDYGLEPSQFSAFSGFLPSYIIDEFWGKLLKIAGKEPVKLVLLPLCARCRKYSRKLINENVS